MAPPSCLRGSLICKLGESREGAGFYDSPGWGKKYQKMQILTIEELLGGKEIDMPPLGEVSVTFKKAQKAKPKEEEHPELFRE